MKRIAVVATQVGKVEAKRQFICYRGPDFGPCIPTKP
jgi:hypothetical protein